jgi:hypothetical protein
MTSAYHQHEFITDWIDRSSDDPLDGAATGRRATVWPRFDRGKARRTHADRRAMVVPARVGSGDGGGSTTTLLVVARQRI